MPDVDKEPSFENDDRHPAKSQIPISESTIRWAMARSGLDEIALRPILPKISQWIKGELHPSLRELERLANITSTPLGFFFLQEPPNDQLSIPHFRTVKTGLSDQSPSPNLIDTIQLMERRQNWMRDYLLDQGSEPLPYVHSASLGDDPRRIADNIRITLGLPEEWASEQPNWGKALQELRISIENAGILLVVSGIVGNNTRRKLDVSEFRGFVLVDEYAPLVFVNGADGKAAQMFTLAHELAHIWFGKSAVFDLKELQPANEAIERESNAVAAEFLVPSEQLLDFWPSLKGDPDPFQTIARKFKVSELVAAYRALNLRLIHYNDFNEFYNAYEKERHEPLKKTEGGDFYANQNLRIGRRFAIAVISAAREGTLLYRDAYQLTGLYGDTFERYAKSLGLV